MIDDDDYFGLKESVKTLDDFNKILLDVFCMNAPDGSIRKYLVIEEPGNFEEVS